MNMKNRLRFIIDTIAEYYNIEKSDLYCRSKIKIEGVSIRVISGFLCRELTDALSSMIAEVLNISRHLLIHSIADHYDILHNNEVLLADFSNIIKIIKKKDIFSVCIGKSFGDNDDIYLDFDIDKNVLVTGKTGSGKTICMTKIIDEFVEKIIKDSLDVNLIIIDNKRFEYIGYENINSKIQVFSDYKKSLEKLNSICSLIDRRKETYVNDDNINETKVIIFIDEFADFMMWDNNFENILEKIVMQGQNYDVHVMMSTQCTNSFVLNDKIVNKYFKSVISFELCSEDWKRILGDEVDELDEYSRDMIYKIGHYMPRDIEKIVRISGYVRNNIHVKIKQDMK